MANPVKPQAAMTKNGQPFYPLTTIDQVLDSGGNRLSVDSTIQVYTHTKTNNVHNFVGTGANGRAKITADFASGDTFQVNGAAVTAYWGNDAPDSDLIATGRWVTFIVDGKTINFKPGGGLTSSKLAQATATESDVLSGKTFYAGDKTMKTGTIASKGAESVTLNASTTSKTFNTSGKYCTGNMTVNTSTKAAESKTITPSGSAQSYTFATSGKLCTGNMTVSVPAVTIHSTSWPVRSDIRGSNLNLETRNIGAPDGAGTYAWTATCGTWNGNANSPVEFHFMGNDYSVKYGNAQNFQFSGINYFDSSTTYTGRQWGGWLWFFYIRLY